MSNVKHIFATYASPFSTDEILLAASILDNELEIQINDENNTSRISTSIRVDLHGGDQELRTKVESILRRYLEGVASKTYVTIYNAVWLILISPFGRLLNHRGINPEAINTLPFEGLNKKSDSRLKCLV